MAAPNLMDNGFLKILMKGDSKKFHAFLKSKEAAQVALDIHSGSESDDPPPVVSPTGEASPNSIPVGLIELPITSKLRRVTSAGDGVLHIAARHGHLNLVCAVFDTVRRLETDSEQTEAEEVTGERRGSFKATMWQLCQWVKCCRRAEGTAGCLHGENAAPGREEAEIREDETRGLLPSPAGAGNSQNRDGEDDPAAQGTIKFVELLRAKNDRGETCLHEAIRWGHTLIVEKLIAEDQELGDVTTTNPLLVKMMNEDGASPLYLATTLRRLDIVKCLTAENYKYRDSVSSAGPAERTALHAAVLLNKGLCETLLKWDKSLAKCKDKSENTPLHYLGTSDTAIAKLILDLNHDVSSGDWTNSKGSLPIHVAAARGRLDVIKKLVEKCPECVSSCNRDGQTFLHVAVLNGEAKIVKYVCTDPKFLHLLNMRDNNGDTALHLAVQKGQEYTFCHLFGNKEVCLSFKNKEGHTPVDLAFFSIDSPDLGSNELRGQEWILNDLLVAGADSCTCGWDHLISNSGIEEPTHDEKEKSEKLSKSATLVAAGATLILSISFAAPFTMANKNNLPVDNGAGVSQGKDSAQKRAESLLSDLVSADTAALFISSFALFFCIIAGFHKAGIRTRSMCLYVGGFLLYEASQQIVTVFATGLLQVYPTYPLKTSTVLAIWSLKVELSLYCASVVISTLNLNRVYAHGRTRSSRLGFKTSVCSLFRCPPGASTSPRSHTILLLVACVVWIILFVLDIKYFSELKMTKTSRN